MNVLDLFSGIGGFSLGLKRAGMRTVAFCEVSPFCRRVLAERWPGVPIHHDVRGLTGADVSRVDVICGGFPCQDISVAGKGAGITGERSGLWSEYARLIGELRPRYVIVENVAALLGRGLSVVLGNLSEIGYDAEWSIISAANVGAPHRRDRIWIVAYPHGKRCEEPRFSKWNLLSHQERECQAPESEWHNEQSRPVSANALAYTGQQQRDGWRDWTCGWRREPEETLRDARRGGRQEAWMSIPESLLGRVAYGLPNQLDRLASLGNAVVPQIPELIGRAIIEYEGTVMAAIAKEGDK